MMIMLAEKRRKRGEVTEAEIVPFLSMHMDELLRWLSSPEAAIRTCTATALGNYKVSKVVAGLCQQLEIEKKLYCKIAISDSLAKIGSLSVLPLLALLGKIGQNQESEIPQKGFNKISYPLPRDIAARVLCRMDGDIWSDVIEFLENERDHFKIEQVIDVIGHIVYTKKLEFDSRILMRISEKYKESPMIQFKLTRCFSGFSDDLAKQFLYNILKSSDRGFQFEAARSLVLSGHVLRINDHSINEDVLVFTKQLSKRISGRKKPRH